MRIAFRNLLVLVCLPWSARADAVSLDIIFSNERIIGGIGCPLDSAGNVTDTITTTLYAKPELDAALPKPASIAQASLQLGDWCALLYTQRIPIDSTHAFYHVPLTRNAPEDKQPWGWILLDTPSLSPSFNKEREILDLALTTAQDAQNITEFGATIEDVPMQKLAFRAKLPRIFVDKSLTTMITQESLFVGSNASTAAKRAFQDNPPDGVGFDEFFSSLDGVSALARGIDMIQGRAYVHFSMYDVVHYETQHNEVKTIGFWVRDAWTPAYDAQGRIALWLIGQNSD